MALLRAVLIVVLCAASAHARGVRVGDPVPALSLPDDAGHAIAIGGHGKVRCIDFWASWCGHCRTALPALDAIARRHAAQGLEVLAVGIDQDAGAASRFLAATLPERTITVLHDRDGTARARFAPSGMPSLWLVDADGTVRFAAEGYDPATLPDIEREIERLLGSSRER